jgi:L-amino acid N-acyltransferase YncA
MIRAVEMKDIQEICSIYNYYIANTTVTFEEEPISAEEMKKRILEVTPSYPWLVYEDHEAVIGYAYASRWKPRAAYRQSVELSIYLSKDHLGNGIGKKLYETLLGELRKTDVHAVIGGMSLPNEQSERLHESLGFKKIAEFKEVGYKFHKWIDVGYWEFIINN